MMIVVMADISSLKRAEQERDSWMQALAHDLNSPLAAALLSAELGLRHLTHGNTNAAGGAFERSVESTQRLSGMIKQLNDLTRHRTHGTLDLHLEPFDLVPLAQEAVQEAGASSPLHQVHLESDSPEIPIVADAERLRRVFDNLLGNAIKYSPGGGQIGVKVEREHDQVVVSISDTGIGISSEDRSRIFDRFQRGSNVGAIRGSGLGLSFCQTAIEAHGGQLAVDSTHGVGTTVTVHLPLAPVETVEPSPSAPLDGHADGGLPEAGIQEVR